MKAKNYLSALLFTGLASLIPLAGELFVDSWDWGVGGFVFFGIVVYLAALLYQYGKTRSGNLFYRVGFTLAILTSFMVFWITAAVKIIGEENPGNIMYGAVLIIALLGAFLSRFEAKGVERTLYATAVAQMLVPTITFILSKTTTSGVWSDFAPGVLQVFEINAFFALLWIASALLFRNSAKPPLTTVTE